MRGSFSTDRVAAKDAFAYWSDLVCDVFVKLDCNSTVRDRFKATMLYDTLGWLRVVEAESDAIEAQRSRRQIAKGCEDDLLVSIQIKGKTQLIQDGHEAVLNAGDFALYDSSRPYVLRMSDDTRLICLQFPRSEIVGRLGPVSPFVARTVGGEHGVSSLFLELARMLPKRVSELDKAAAEGVAEHVVDLLALSLGSKRGDAFQLANGHAAMRSRLKQAIRRHIRDPDFCPTLAARSAGISVRHANRLLAEENTSLGRFIIGERLAGCREMLSDAYYDNLSIGEIAYSYGFNDLSHFSRAFRARYGRSPKEYRSRRTRQPFVAT